MVYQTQKQMPRFLFFALFLLSAYNRIETSKILIKEKLIYQNKRIVRFGRTLFLRRDIVQERRRKY